MVKYSGLGETGYHVKPLKLKIRVRVVGPERCSRGCDEDASLRGVIDALMEQEMPK